jgi:hypothetical protein
MFGCVLPSDLCYESCDWEASIVLGAADFALPSSRELPDKPQLGSL